MEFINDVKNIVTQGDGGVNSNSSFVSVTVIKYPSLKSSFEEKEVYSAYNPGYSPSCREVLQWQELQEANCITFTVRSREKRMHLGLLSSVWYLYS